MTKRTCTAPNCGKPHRARDLCSSHYRAALHAGLLVTHVPDVFERIAQRIEYANTGCWLWTGARWGNGYAKIMQQRRSRVAHRVLYELHHGPVDDALVLDHLCRVPLCVNPDHLEPVPQRINILRGEHQIARVARTGRCDQGHELSGDNLYQSPKGEPPRCRACMRINRAKRWAKTKQAEGRPDRRVAGTCGVDNCERKHYAKGVCKRHYQSSRRVAQALAG